MIRKISNFKFQILNFKASGQSLIEVVIAVGVVVALALSLVTTSLLTQKTSRGARNNIQATKLVQQSIEQVRVFRDRNNLGSFPADGTCYKLVVTDPNPQIWNFVSGAVNCPESIAFNNVTFSRTIAVSTVNASKKLIAVSVSWTDSSGTQTVQNQTYLTSWCQGQIVGGLPCPSP